MNAFRSLVLAGLIAFSPSVLADEPGPDGGSRPPHGEKGKGEHGKGERPSMADKLKEPLGLTEEQVKKIRAIEAEHKAEMEKAREARAKNGEHKGERHDKEALRKHWKEQRDKLHDKIKTVLTDEQKKKFEQHLARMEERAREEREKKRDGNKAGEKKQPI